MIVHTQHTDAAIKFTQDYVVLRKLLVKKSKTISKQFLRRWIQLRGIRAVEESRKEMKLKLRSKRVRKMLKRQSAFEKHELEMLKDGKVPESN